MNYFGGELSITSTPMPDGFESKTGRTLMARSEFIVLSLLIAKRAPRINPHKTLGSHSIRVGRMASNSA